MIDFAVVYIIVGIPMIYICTTIGLEKCKTKEYGNISPIEINRSIDDERDISNIEYEKYEDQIISEKYEIGIKNDDKKEDEEEDEPKSYYELYPSNI